MEVRKRCSCGNKEVQFHLKDNIMSAEVIDQLFCPNCSDKAASFADEVVMDNGWAIQYDIDIARMFVISKLQLDPAQVNPEFIFDNGYATWREMYPGETEDIVDERKAIIAKKDANPKSYVQEITSWSINRVARLKEEGWRKAQQA